MKISREDVSFALNTLSLIVGIAATTMTLMMTLRVRSDVAKAKVEFAQHKAQIAAMIARAEKNSSIVL